MKNILCLFLLSFALTASAGAAESKLLVNVDKNGVGLQGYDPVGFFTQNKPVKGDPKIKSTIHGVTYYFASADNKTAFDKDPAKYEPQYGGYCAYGVSRDKLVEVEVDAFQIVGGRLLMQYDKGIRDDFAKDLAGNLKLANQNWPALVDKNGKPAPAGEAAPAAKPAATTATPPATPATPSK
jgi:YHS domain-containing protein